MSLLDGLEKDLQELVKFLHIAERKTTQDLLKKDIERIQLLIEKVFLNCHFSIF